MEKKPLAPGLYVAATPIGNLGDVTDRLRQVLGQVDTIYCEDTRVTGKLLQALGLKTPMRPYHDHNGAQMRPAILDALGSGKALALVSDAGTPLISDPGYKLVHEVRAAGHPLFAIPGPCAAIAALSIAGAPTDRFSFQGFLPPKSGARQSRLLELKQRGETVILYETGPRLAATLKDIADTYGPVRVQIARELTKLHEEVIEGIAADLSAQYLDHPPKGEIVLILPPVAQESISDADVEAMMVAALRSMSLKDASSHVAEQTGRRKRDLYQQWLNRDA